MVSAGFDARGSKGDRSTRPPFVNALVTSNLSGNDRSDCVSWNRCFFHLLLYVRCGPIGTGDQGIASGTQRG